MINTHVEFITKKNFFIFLSLSIFSLLIFPNSFAQDAAYSFEIESSQPLVKDRTLVIEEFVTGLDWPTTMTFIGNDILVLEKNKGTVRLIQDGILQEKPVYTIPVVDHTLEHGMLGIVSKENTVYLYYSEYGIDEKPEKNRIFKYTWNGSELINPIHLKDLPAGSLVHNGGAMEIDSEGTVYAVIGNIGERKGILQNFSTGESDDTSVILQVDPPGPYYAIGIRNSFGLAFDPITGFLWDTENGEDKFDEINLVQKKFNSGWEQIMGPNTANISWSIPEFQDYIYSDPEFSFEIANGLAAISFIDSPLFENLKDSVMVGDFINGNLYVFPLNNDRTAFDLKIPLDDLVANTDDTVSEILFAKDFGGVTDIEVGPDGKIYVVSIMNGIIYQIAPNENFNESELESCDYTSKLIGNLSGCDLSNLDLSNRNLSFIDFSNSNLSYANMTGSRLSGADLSNANLQSVNLQNSISDFAIFQYTNMDDVNLENSNFEGANLNKANISNANLQKSVFANAHFTGANMENSNLSESDFSLATMIDVNLQNSYLEKTRLTYANLTNANLKDSSIINSIIGKTNMTRVNLDGATILDTYPWDTSFKDVNFTQNTKSNSCLNDNFQSKFINKILYEIRQINSVLLSPFEIISNFC